MPRKQDEEGKKKKTAVRSRSSKGELVILTGTVGVGKAVCAEGV